MQVKDRSRWQEGPKEEEGKEEDINEAEVLFGSDTSGSEGKRRGQERKKKATGMQSYWYAKQRKAKKTKERLAREGRATSSRETASDKARRSLRGGRYAPNGSRPRRLVRPERQKKIQSQSATAQEVFES
jgi:hypothetical protein